MDVRILLIPKRENPPTIKANKASSTGKLVAHFLEDTRLKHPGESQRWKYRETCRGNVDYRNPGIPYSTVQKEDSNRKETVKRLIQQFENHPNWDSLILDKNKTEEFDPFSEKSKELITAWAIRNTSSFARLLERYSAFIALCIGKRALYTARAASTGSLEKGIDSWTRQDTTSCQFPAALSTKHMTC